MYSQTFPIAGTPRIILPGSYLSAAGRVVMATGIIKKIIGLQDALNLETTIEVFDGFDANGNTFRSTNRVKREIDITAAAAMRQSVFECYGTGLTGGPSLTTYNRKASFYIPGYTDGAGTGSQVGGQVQIDCDILCVHGMIVQVSGSTNSQISVVYEPRTLGKHWWDRASFPVEVF